MNELTDEKIADAVIDSIYNGSTIIQIAEKLNVNPQELQRVHRQDTWNMIRKLALGEICRIRVWKRELPNDMPQIDPQAAGSEDEEPQREAAKQ